MSHIDIEIMRDCGTLLLTYVGFPLFSSINGLHNQFAADKNRRLGLRRSIAINPVVNDLSPSKIIEINGLIKELEAKGEKIFSLCIGEPDYLPPEAVLEGTVRAFVLSFLGMLTLHVVLRHGLT